MNPAVEVALKRGMHFLNRGLAPIDRILFQKPNTDPATPLFIVGAPRSGSTLLYQAIAHHFQVGYFIDIANYLYGLSNYWMLLTRELAPRSAPVFESQYGKTRGFFAPAESGNFWFQWFPRDGEGGHYSHYDEYPAGHFDGLRMKIDSMVAILNKPVVFKSLYLGMSISSLAKVFPKARFVFVRRDVLHTSQSLYFARLRRKNPHAWWSVKIPGYRRLLKFPIWRQVLEQAFYTQQIVARDLDRFAPGRSFVVDYLSFCHEPHAVIRKLAAWLKRSGFCMYPEMHLPACFRPSVKLRLERDIIAKMSNHLERLQEQNPQIDA